MTVPLMVLAFFAITYGWVGIPEHFPLLGGILPNWFHDFVGHTLEHVPEAPAFSWVPLLTSIFVALGGLTLGWLVYRNVRTPAGDRLQFPVLKHKWYFDEAYDFLFIKPAYWFAETFVYKWMDKGAIDGFLHFIARATGTIGTAIRTYIDLKVINEFMGDGTGRVVQWMGVNLRPIQTGRIQQYMLTSLVILLLVGAVLFYLMA